ncbi:hypothetical protein GCM10010218_13000 [Streptomyces mashuensis]|uniref:Nudix hydrolase domain-containing protein n=1 Tax=Streptomyces mashuensis TaxID=33904 RepID=A0A919EBH1_9ACTN|nr:hypothetical protein GCM10010218_13000 [Streptomyces mashuensis]
MSEWLPLNEYVGTLPKAAMFAGLYFTDTAGRPFQMLSARREDVWQFPGGDTDHGETPFETAVRECREETGRDFTGQPRLLATIYMPVGLWPVPKTGFIFDGGTLSPKDLKSIRLDPHEHSRWEVRDLDEWADVLNPSTWGRLAAVDRARRTGHAVYLEHEEVPQ